MRHGKLLGVRECRVQPLPHSRREFLAEYDSRPFVPVVRVFDIAGRFRADDDVAGHRPVVRSRATISSQGMPVAPPRSMLSMRWSSSARCGGVKGIECGVSARLSHSCSTRRSRSSNERRPMSICGVDRTIVSHRLVPASTSLDAQLAALTPGGVMAGGRRSAADPRAILGVRLPRAQRHVPEWRNWQTRGTQNPVGFTPRVGSIPSSGTMNKALSVIRLQPREGSIRPIVPLLWLCRVSA